MGFLDPPESESAIKKMSVCVCVCVCLCVCVWLRAESECQQMSSDYRPILLKFGYQTIIVNV